MAEIYARHFALHKYQTKIVKNFAEANKKISRALPDLVVVDIALEESSGLKWLKVLRHEVTTSKILIVVLTGVSDRESIHEALESGADKYFLKSQITPHALAGQIDQLFNKTPQLS
ncbi:MAG: Two-component system sensor histidine kinase/response regulator, hybrid [Candidatus Uhrbacteria bacterium GW2011_GWE2_45_35]|uniref:Two-component system sensor histidine kinase/response regulator, hybrid n=2 Tax=Candidatus Uhriibacteriota TaxID=1752732 RepID=A0A0G1JKL4_9BACT|nr:MAG: Two-component system sensor histidine kinase/response regulator, hybrid [Candidatus Uhrbacteria bacterium GW2011_GWF2_44_350]KKU08767.1 MAG: Two-component system sensor histidine kinase/response regulator, hybrid [Candidatus Uhrbacteria bacterium GW2011_GWE2_45_35]